MRNTDTMPTKLAASASGAAVAGAGAPGGAPPADATPELRVLVSCTATATHAASTQVTTATMRKLLRHPIIAAANASGAVAIRVPMLPIRHARR